MPGGVTYWECDYGTWPLEVSLDYSLRATAQISCKGRVVATNVRACVEWRRGTGDWPDLGCVGGNWTDQTTRIEQTGWLDCIDGTTRRYRAKGIFFWRLDDGQEIGPERVKSSSVKINCDE